MRRKTMKTRRGQAAIEAALVTLVFLATLIGIFDFGQCLFIHQTFVARVRSAVRYGVVRAYDAAAIRNMVLYGQPSTPEGATAGIFGLTGGMVTVTRNDAGTSEQRIVVTIHGYPYRLFSPWIGQTFTGQSIVASAPVETP
jgi:Flp pilus assembly protein TadG